MALVADDSKLTIIAKGLQLVLHGAKKLMVSHWCSLPLFARKKKKKTHEALVELGVGLRTIDLETLCFLGVRHRDM
jgi:hypothetical protein